MTGTPAHKRESPGHWLNTRHRALLDGLGRYLDPDAGLRGITVHADHERLISVFASYLDPQAGLLAILPAPAAFLRQGPGQRAAVAAITAADPAARIVLRRNPIIMAAILSNLTVRALTIADKGPDHDLASDLNRARDRDLDLVLNFDLDRVLDRARDLASALDFDLDRALALARALARASALALTLAAVSSSDLDHARDHARALDDALARHRDGSRDLYRTRALDWAHCLDKQIALMVGAALGLGQVEGLAAALLEGALDDFTHADLASADLAYHDLIGIRWSEWGTTWPTGTDADALRARSREVVPGVGVYEITRPDYDDKARHYAPV
jgi:hypothetical protein